MLLIFFLLPEIGLQEEPLHFKSLPFCVRMHLKKARRTFIQTHTEEGIRKSLPFLFMYISFLSPVHACQVIFEWLYSKLPHRSQVEPMGTEIIDSFSKVLTVLYNGYFRAYH